MPQVLIPKIIVAASDSPASWRQRAKYVCDGSDDDAKIQSAIDSLPASGGVVKLSEGIFNFSSGVTLGSNITIEGASGMRTTIHRTAANVAVRLFTATGSDLEDNAVKHVCIRRLNVTHEDGALYGFSQFLWAKFCSVEDIHYVGPATQTSGAAVISDSRIQHGSYRRIHAEGLSSTGSVMLINTIYDSVIEDIYGSQGQDCIDITIGERLTFRRIKCRNASSEGFDLGAVSDSVFEDIDIDGCPKGIGIKTEIGAVPSRGSNRNSFRALKIQNCVQGVIFSSGATEGSQRQTLNRNQFSDVTIQTDPKSHSGTAQAGSSTTITLDAGAAGADDYYNDSFVSILSGTGANQSRRITDYVASTRVATVASAWSTNPDSTSVFYVGKKHHTGTAQAGTSTSITLDTNASDTDDYYVPYYVKIVGGTGSGQEKLITDYNGTTKVATIDPTSPFSPAPDATSIFRILSDAAFRIVSGDDTSVPYNVGIVLSQANLQSDNVGISYVHLKDAKISNVNIRAGISGVLVSGGSATNGLNNKWSNVDVEVTGTALNNVPITWRYEDGLQANDISTTGGIIGMQLYDIARSQFSNMKISRAQRAGVVLHPCATKQMTNDTGSIGLSFTNCNVTDCNLAGGAAGTSYSSWVVYSNGTYVPGDDVMSNINWTACGIEDTQSSPTARDMTFAGTNGGLFGKIKRVDNWRWDDSNSLTIPSGNGNTINGVGTESANAETPTASGWDIGDVVVFTDSGDGSGDGIYLLVASSTWSKIA